LQNKGNWRWKTRPTKGWGRWPPA